MFNYIFKSQVTAFQALIFLVCFPSHKTGTQASRSLVTPWSRNFRGLGVSLCSCRLWSLCLERSCSSPQEVRQGSPHCPLQRRNTPPQQPENAPSTHMLSRSHTLHIRPLTLGLSGPTLLHSSMSNTRRQFLGYLAGPPVITTDNAPPEMEAAISSVQLRLKKKLTYRKNARFAVMLGNSPLWKYVTLTETKVLRINYLRLFKMSTGNMLSSISYIHETKLNYWKNMTLFTEIHFNKSHKNCQYLAPSICK